LKEKRRLLKRSRGEKVPTGGGGRRTDRSRKLSQRFKSPAAKFKVVPISSQEQRFRTYIEEANDLIFTLDTSGKITSANRATYEITGYTAGELLGRMAIDFVAHETQDRVRKALRRVTSGERLERVEAEIISKEGRRICLEIRGRLIREGKRRVGTFYIARNITKRKQVEEKLNALHRHALRLSTANSIDEIVNWTLDAMEFTLGFDEADFCTVEDRLVNVRGSRGMSVSPSEWPVDGPGLVVKAVRTKKTLRVPDTRKEKDFVDARSLTEKRELPSMLSELTVPVIGDGEVVAVLNVENRRPNAFTEEDQRLLETLAMHVASALSRLEQTEKREKLVAAVQESENRYRTLFESAGDAIFISHVGGRFLEVNRAACERLGYSREELLQMSPKDIDSPEYASRVAQRVEELRKVGHAFLETAQIRRDRTIIPVELSSRIIEYKGKPAVLSVARDVTERKQAEKALMESEAQYKSLFHDSPIPFWLEDHSELKKYLDDLRSSGITDFGAYLKSHPETAMELASKVKVLDVNKAALAIHEASNRQELQEGLPRFFTEETRDSFARQLIAMAEGATRYESEYAIITSLGKKKRVHFTWSVPPGYERSLSKVFASQIDITERKEMEDELSRYSSQLEELVFERTRKLQESERKYRSVVENIPDVVWTADREGNTVFVSPNVERVYGYTPEEIYRRDYGLWFQRVHPDDIERLREAYQTLFKRNEALDAEYRFQKKDGEWVWLHDRATMTYEKDGAQYTDGVTSDITDRKQIEEKLHKAERLAGIGELAAMVGHDLRNPLTGIASAAYYLKVKLGSEIDGRAKQMLDLIEQGIEHSNEIISDLLDYSREVRLEPSQISVRSIMAQALAQVKIPRRVDVVDSTKDEPSIMADSQKIKRVFVNLIENAIDAMPKGGTLAIASTEIDDSLRISFTDTGAGIPGETMKKMWRPLFTTKAKGIGLGLPICKRFVEAHGGTIALESEAGKGTTVTVTLPLTGSQKEVKQN